VMIGDDLLCDIEGAIDFGMQAIYFNPHEVKHNLSVLGNVKDLIEIKAFL
jgi:FMN phosphatase YigB (HAD superfamily)